MLSVEKANELYGEAQAALRVARESLVQAKKECGNVAERAVINLVLESINDASKQLEIL